MDKTLRVEKRVKISLLIEKMNRQKTYSEKLGLEDMSKFHGQFVNELENLNARQI